jgi:PncC family amidohydrolase
LKLTGLGESGMETRIRDIYRAVPKGITVTTLAVPGDLSIHLTYQGPGPAAAAEALLEGLDRKMRRRLTPWIYSSAGESLEEVVGRLLKEKGKTLACAESCTGGLIGHRLTEVPGSSDYFLESAVVYSNRAKVRRLGVPASLIDRHGAVSAAVARQMAVGVRKACRADYGLSITGIAGPEGGTPRKPVGLVYIALARDGGVAVHRKCFFGGRSQVKFQSTQAALDILRKALLAKRLKAHIIRSRHVRENVHRHRPRTGAQRGSGASRRVFEEDQGRRPLGRSMSGMHLTLKFLGETGRKGSSVQEVLAKVAARHRAFSLVLAGTGSFPQGPAPRVLWAGVERQPALISLQEDIDRELGSTVFRARSGPSILT